LGQPKKSTQPRLSGKTGGMSTEQAAQKLMAPISKFQEKEYSTLSGDCIFFLIGKVYMLEHREEPPPVFDHPLDEGDKNQTAGVRPQTIPCVSVNSKNAALRLYDLGMKKS